MHSGSQVLITAIAWGAGLQQDKRDKGETEIDPKHDAPKDIQDAYNALRGFIKSNDKYKDVCNDLVQIEDKLRSLNTKLSGIQLSDDPEKFPIVTPVRKLLSAIDKKNLPTWESRIIDYEKPDSSTAT